MRRRRLALLGSVAATAVVAGFGASALLARREGVARVGSTRTDLSAPRTVDVGIAARGSGARFSYEIVNTSTVRTVEITNVATTCGCTSATPMVRTLAPGETTVVEGEIAATEDADDFSVRVRLEDSLGGKTDTRLTLRHVDPLPASAVANVDGALRLPINALYHADEYDWRAYAASTDEPLPIEFDVDESGSTLTITAHAGVDEIVILFIEKEGERTRRMQRVAVRHAK